LHDIGKRTHADQWNKIEDSEESSHSYRYLMLNKDAKSIHWKKSGIEKFGYPHVED
jgi:hypothetical protein